MTMFNSLPVNSVLFAVIMIAHCIQKFKIREYKQENFDGLRVLSKFCVDDKSKEEPYELTTPTSHLKMHQEYMVQSV